jgi:hypothetical protein
VKGLFQELLLSRAESLHNDAEEFPEKYDPRVPPILRELVSTRRQPTPEERKLLDLAVLDFASKKPSNKPTAHAPARNETHADQKSPGAEAGMSVPEAIKPFWWL